MTSALPILIATWAVTVTVCVMAAMFALMSLTSAFKRRPAHLGDLVGRAIGATIIFAIPLAVAVPVGLLASALLIGVGAPPITYLFVLLAALVSFRAATRHSSAGMEGCNKAFGLIWSGYAIAWCGASFHLTGGLQSFEADAVSLRWLQPPLAALPFALLVVKLSTPRKRNAWLLLGFWACIAAMMALCFYPVERGFAAAVLPESDWLRFPLVGLALVALFSLIRLGFVLRAKPNVRRSRLRDLRSNGRILAGIFVAMGLSWAAARAVVGALV